MSMQAYFKQKQTVQTFWLLFSLTILTLIGMQVTGAPLKTAAAPGGIVTFELVGSLSGSQAVLESWHGQTMIYAGINMGLDFLFLTLYGFTLALACMLISERLPAQWKLIKQLGIWLAVGVLLAALLDISENISLVKILLGSQNHLLPRIARWCAIPKFILIILALFYMIGGALPAYRNSRQFK